MRAEAYSYPLGTAVYQRLVDCCFEKVEEAQTAEEFVGGFQLQFSFQKILEFCQGCVCPRLGMTQMMHSTSYLLAIVSKYHQMLESPFVLETTVQDALVSMLKDMLLDKPFYPGLVPILKWESDVDREAEFVWMVVQRLRGELGEQVAMFHSVNHELLEIGLHAFVATLSGRWTAKKLRQRLNGGDTQVEFEFSHEITTLIRKAVGTNFRKILATAAVNVQQIADFESIRYVASLVLAELEQAESVVGQFSQYHPSPFEIAKREYGSQMYSFVLPTFSAAQVLDDDSVALMPMMKRLGRAVGGVGWVSEVYRGLIMGWIWGKRGEFFGVRKG
eukprot:TRINITY_DN3417_c0_g2_i3.p1 TRINITY_DN3417_c0_g2~~TRINITY_DN3417_c0_g2_i3.p1  ORF type:complete len:332 (+),score=73.23 TRINITY_DN3417_c0_g2_i3:176-1171(+)